MNIIGRKNEINILESLYKSKKSEFVAVYGRRRVGKTFLIRELFKNRLTFYHTGLSPFDRYDGNLMHNQIKSFYNSMVSFGLEPEEKPMNWLDAFFMLERALSKIDNGQRMVIFIDELPWMDTPKSLFIMALEHFWNSWCNFRNNVLLVVCGSATSWMVHNLINNIGGLYNRLTDHIKLEPFTLCECKEFFQSKGISMSHYEIVETYMALGGIPMYLEQFKKGLSVAQNLDKIIFNKNAKLSQEFKRLFGSMFINPDAYESVIKAISKKRSGCTRNEIIESMGKSTGGGISKIIEALQENDFIISYKPFGLKKTIKYKLTDPFCLTWLQFMADGKAKENFWVSNYKTTTLNSWRGLAFENVCFKHISQIKNKLECKGVLSTEQPLIVYGDDGKAEAQIDMLILRNDNVVNMCEIKFSKDEFVIDEKYRRKVEARADKLLETLPKKSSVYTTFITTYGIAENMHSCIVQNSVIMEDLFV